MSRLTPEEVKEVFRSNTEAVDQIRQAYIEAETALKRAGKLLRTSCIKGYMWTADHKTILTGQKAVITRLRHDLPDYSGKRRIP